MTQLRELLKASKVALATLKTPGYLTRVEERWVIEDLGAAIRKAEAIEKILRC